MTRPQPKFEPMPMWGVYCQAQIDQAADFMDSLLCPVEEDRDETDAESALPVW